ncbi:MAG: hypothetical protein ACRDSZ_14010 [Pseudonocardiaceae bacterium]
MVLHRLDLQPPLRRAPQAAGGMAEDGRAASDHDEDDPDAAHLVQLPDGDRQRQAH